MTCCSHCEAVEKVFDTGVAADDLNDYRKHGPARQTKALLDAIRRLGVEGRTLIDIGGGVGAIQHELFKAGVTSAVSVDASSAYLGAAQEEATRQGYMQHVRYLHGDFVQLADSIEPADIVTLDRVICCYPDMQALVSLSSAHATKLYGLVFPRDAWWMRIGGRLFNVFYWIQRNPFRFFVHSFADVDAVARSQGFHQQLRKQTGMWQVVVYARYYRRIVDSLSKEGRKTFLFM